MKRLQYDVLVVVDYYLPGRKAGGPVTTVANLMDALGDEVKFLILTRRRDLDGSVYEGLLPGRITRVGKADVLYLDETQLNFRDLLQYAYLSGARTIYLNSFFSTLTLRFLVLRRLGLLRLNVILAPRGEFSSAAYAMKGFQKRVYRQLLSSLGLLRSVRWQVSSPQEGADLKRVMGSPEDLQVAPDLFAASPSSGTHEADFVFISRISPMKNLLYVLERLAELRRSASLDIYGPLEDAAYWESCRQKIQSLPPHITVRYQGNLEHGEVQATFGRYAAFVFPTLGENYGHVIPEALSAGTPVIVSDRTPWLNLESAGVGWVRPLEQPEGYAQAMEAVLSMNSSQRQELAQRCVAYVQALQADSATLDQNRTLFTRPFN